MENVVARSVAEEPIYLGSDVSQIVQVARDMVVDGESGRAVAAEFLKTVKSMKNTVVDSWKPFKVDAKAIYDRVRKQEKDMLDPLDEADRLVRAKVVDSVKREEEEKRRKAEQLRELARKEAEAKLAEATKASASGDEFTAEMAMAEAEVYEQASGAVRADSVAKTKGIQYITTWDVTVTDASKVPVVFAGVELRPVDIGAVKKLVRASKGTIQIPGIKIEETKSTRIR